MENPPRRTRRGATKSWKCRPVGHRPLLSSAVPPFDYQPRILRNARTCARLSSTFAPVVRRSLWPSLNPGMISFTTQEGHPSPSRARGGPYDKPHVHLWGTLPLVLIDLQNLGVSWTSRRPLRAEAQVVAMQSGIIPFVVRNSVSALGRTGLEEPVLEAFPRRNPLLAPHSVRRTGVHRGAGREDAVSHRAAGIGRQSRSW